MLDVRIVPDPTLHRLLLSHPHVRSVSEAEIEPRLAWSQDGWERSVYVSHPEIPLIGLVELTDNNPLVCADSFSVASPAATLASVALGPLAEAGLIVERPTMLVNVETTEDEIAPFLASFGWAEGLTVASEPTDLGGAIAATVICAVTTPKDLSDLDDLFEERYGRSFFVRRDETSDWHVDLVLGKAHALYRLRIAPDEPHSLLTIQVMADRDGKCGAAQIVHAMNVMVGYEESLGIS